MIYIIQIPAYPAASIYFQLRTPNSSCNTILPCFTGINSSTLAPHRSSGSEAINIGIKSSKHAIYACLNQSAAPPYFTIKITTPLDEIKFETFYVSRVASPI